MEVYCILTYQDSVTVNDGIEPVSNGKDRALLKLVPDSLLDEAVGSKGAENTTPQHKEPASYGPLGREFYLTGNNGSSAVRYVLQDIETTKDSRGPEVYKDPFILSCIAIINQLQVIF